MTRSWLPLLVVLLLGLIVIDAGVAHAQQPAAQPPTRQAPPPGQLPRKPPPIRPDMRDALRQRQAGRLGRPAPPTPAAQPAVPVEEPKAQLYPRDEHGECLGHGPNDRPAEINLVHGWLGTNNEKAVPSPGPIGSKDWWLWRITPYPWRYENHEDHCDPRNEPIPLLAGIINLAALAFLLVRFGRKPLREALVKRRADVTSEMEKARRIKVEAQKRVDRYADELDHLDDTLVSLRDQYAAEGERDEQRVLDEMDQTRERMLADADFRLSQEEKVLHDSLSHQALHDALTAAEELIVAKLTDKDHERLADEYLEQVGAALSKGSELEGRS